MKISIDKEVITIAEKALALDLIRDMEWIDKAHLQDYARRITANEDTSDFFEKVLNYGNMTITKNHFQLVVWVDDFTFMTCNHIYIVSGDLSAYFNSDQVEAFIQRYDLAAQYTR